MQQFIDTGLLEADKEPILPLSNLSFGDTNIFTITLCGLNTTRGKRIINMEKHEYVYVYIGLPPLYAIVIHFMRLCMKLGYPHAQT